MSRVEILKILHNVMDLRNDSLITNVISLFEEKLGHIFNLKEDQRESYLIKEIEKAEFLPNIVLTGHSLLDDPNRKRGNLKLYT